MKNTTIDDIVADAIQDAVDYIGNEKESFDIRVDNTALKDIRSNKNFHQRVVDEVASSPREHAEVMQNQKAAADFIWGLYVEWAYGPQ